MNEKTAYAIAAAVEKKLGECIGLWRTPQLWSWVYEGYEWALLRNSDMAPSVWAQWLLNEMRKHVPKKVKRRKIEDD